MSFGPLDGPVPGRPRGVEGTLSDHTPSHEALLGDELLHDAGVDTGLPVRWKVALAVVAAVVVVLVLVALLGG
jgi:hypothetical protein